ncbi:MAG TPA: hypothetical protein PK867_32020 [Pirellulales bacterium]|nr:hypothetical protein [Pirellulales bacterium]
MAKRIRVLDSANRTMQRLGYLKPLCALVNKTETSNLETLGKRLIECVTKRVVISSPLDAQTREYVKNRLTHRSYHDLRNAVLGPANGAPVRLEIQDVCLADARLPSRTGKLAEASWRRYPYLGTSLELIRKGTYSPLTRSLVLLALTPEPFCDLGFLTKPYRDRFSYCTTDRLRTWAARWQQAGNTDEFLRDRFFAALAATRGLPARPVDEDRAVAALVAAGEELKSPLGYSPITDVALLAAARLLADEQLVLEIGVATELLKALQKRDPALVRFTVDRMGTLAYVKFLKPAPSAAK